MPSQDLEPDSRSSAVRPIGEPSAKAFVTERGGLQKLPGIKLLALIGCLWSFAALAHCQTNTNWPSVVTIDAGATVTLPGQPAGYETKDRFFSGGTAYTDTTMGAGGLSTLRFGPRFSYSIPVATGQYVVRFSIVEPNATAPLRRLFKILVNNQESDVLDVFAAVGPRPSVLTIETTAISYFGKIRIDFMGIVGNAIVNQIDVLPAFIGPSSPDTVVQTVHAYICPPGRFCNGEYHVLGLTADGLIARRWKITIP